MKIYLITGAERRVCRLPHPEAAYADVEGVCPKCGSSEFAVAGTGRRPSADDRAWEADAVAACCKTAIGTIRMEPNTLFGVREDEAVLSGRCRVY